MSSSSPGSPTAGAATSGDARAWTRARGGSIGAAALLLVSEAAWVSLAVDAFADGTAGAHRPRIDLPYLAFVLPALVALGVVGLGRSRVRAAERPAGRRWLRRLAVAAAVVAGAALSAGWIAGLSAPGATWVVAFHPWTLPAHAAVAGRAARWGWAVAVLAWARGASLAVSPPSLRHGATSLVAGAAVFLVVFAHQAAAGSEAFTRATGAAGWLLFVFFPLGVTAAAWAQQQDVERRALRRSGRVPNGVWLAVLTLPLALVAFVAFLVGGAGTVVGPAVARVVRAIGAVLGAAGDWIFSHLPQIAIHPGRRLPPTLGRIPLGHHHERLASSSHPSALGIAILCVVGALAVVMIALGLRAVVRWVRRHLRHRTDVGVEEERGSVFTWAHLVTQLRRALVGLWRHLAALFRRGRGTPAPLGAPGSVSEGSETDPVRAAYRGLLSAARAAGRGRAPDETPRELSARLSSEAGIGDLGTTRLRSLTAAYERVRYAGADPAELAQRATTDAAVLVRTLEIPAEGGS